MPSAEATKSQAARALKTTLFVLDQAECSLPENASDPPAAFLFVTKHLPVARELFVSVMTRLEPGSEETAQMAKMYPVIELVADESCKRLRAIESLFDAIKQDYQSGTKNKHYAAAVQRGDGNKIENIMVDLLTSISRVVVEPFVSSEEIERLHEVLEEAKKLPPSLVDDPSAGIHVNNNSSGTQFYHAGNGHQHNCSGGFQVNGDNQNASYTYAEKTKADNN
ncbi:hypothetical protein FVEN_g6500 [Fusarium venenatum]|uniref:NACHT-NTPase and P-loop NTPases N-terminal domain-containing protein n=1 Tax=Fusarium venenatum TaxID=56646 RepID=A0A2L2TJB9_9HYPO|nr:uncharacterized protein FVRRES_04776 [Fusarium venenatum]KAG8355647.1 hypothetical protein FVEN_g6500 [Fusarium venenatum]KAH6991925.1 hypothetical protein EDB82DRAFT_573704 [Fusarium venenatum]CEI60340.1 unnamed protein product [Fusarium venenatum]